MSIFDDMQSEMASLEERRDRVEKKSMKECDMEKKMYYINELEEIDKQIEALDISLAEMNDTYYEEY